MPKDAFWFPHDANARNDPDILDMRSKYGSQGYGWFFMLIEMLREQEGYMLKLNKCNAYAMQLNCQPDAIAAFINDCIHEYGLLSSDDENFWSDSLKRRMANKDRISETRAQAAQKRWSYANAMQMHSKPDAKAMQTDAIRKEKKRKEEKTKEDIKNDFHDGKSMPATSQKTTVFVPPTVDEVAAYCRERDNGIDAQRFCDSYESKGWMIGKNKMKNWQAAVRTWEKNDRARATDGYGRIGEEREISDKWK